MHAAIRPDTPSRSGLVYTCLLITAWLYANNSAIAWLFQSFRYASSFNLILAGFVVAILLVYLVRVSKVRQGNIPHLRLVVSATPQLRLYPLVLMLGSASIAIAFRWILDIQQINVLLFALGTYGLCGLFLTPDLWRKGLPAATLVAFILPFSAQFGSGLGFPVRVLTAQAVEQLLAIGQVSAISSVDIIVLENGIAHVDLPCSGLRSLWTGTLFLLAATWLEGRYLGVRWLLVWASSLLLFVWANTLRVLLLVLITHVWQQPEIAKIIHIPLGIIGFIGACALTWVMLQKVPKYSQSGWGLGTSDSELGEESSSGVNKLQTTSSQPSKHNPIAFSSMTDAAELTYPELNESLDFTTSQKSPNNPKSDRPLGRGGSQNQKLTWLLVVVIALALFSQLRPPQTNPSAIATIHWPEQIVSQPLPLTTAEQRFFDNSAQPTVEKQRFVFGELSGSILLVTSRTWHAHHPPELCFVGNGLKVDQMERKQLTPEVLARWLSLQEGKLSATYWFQSPRQTTDDFLSRIWDYAIHQNKTGVLVSVLFDTARNPESSEIQAFVTAIHNAIADSLQGT